MLPYPRVAYELCGGLRREDAVSERLPGRLGAERSDVGRGRVCLLDTVRSGVIGLKKRY